MCQLRITTIRISAFLGALGVPGGSILPAHRAFPCTKLSNRTPVLIAAQCVSHSNHGGCSHGDGQNRGVLNVENWDPYGPPNSNIWPANNLRATQKSRHVQNSKIPEIHEHSNRTLAAQRTKLPPRNHSHRTTDHPHESCRLGHLRNNRRDFTKVTKVGVPTFDNQPRLPTS